MKVASGQPWWRALLTTALALAGALAAWQLLTAKPCDANQLPCSY